MSAHEDLTLDELSFADFNLMVTEYVVNLTQQAPVAAYPAVAVA